MAWPSAAKKRCRTVFGAGRFTSQPASFRPILHHHTRALAERDLLARLRCDSGPISCHRHHMVVEASEVLDDIVAVAVPDIDPKGKIGLRLHRGESDSTRPRPG